MINYIKQSYRDLVLTISRKETHKVNVLKTLRFKFNSYFIDLSIIGASHFLNINNELFEVFAVNDIKKECLFSEKIDKIDNIFYKFENFTYLFRLINKIEEDNYDLEFNYIFPGENNPETKILLKRINNLVKVYTLHYYPNEFTTVYTETVISFKDKQEKI